MNINEVTHGQRPHVPLSHADGSRLTDKSVRSETVKGSETSRVDSKLIDRLAQSKNETRPDLISDIKARIQNGEFLTREAAESAAKSILDQK